MGLITHDVCCKNHCKLRATVSFSKSCCCKVLFFLLVVVKSLFCCYLISKFWLWVNQQYQASICAEVNLTFTCIQVYVHHQPGGMKIQRIFPHCISPNHEPSTFHNFPNLTRQSYQPHTLNHRDPPRPCGPRRLSHSSTVLWSSLPVLVTSNSLKLPKTCSQNRRW